MSLNRDLGERDPSVLGAGAGAVGEMELTVAVAVAVILHKFKQARYKQKLDVYLMGLECEMAEIKGL